MEARSPGGPSGEPGLLPVSEPRNSPWWPVALVLALLAVLVLLLLAHPAWNVLSARAVWPVAIGTAVFLIGLLTGYAALTDFVLTGRFLSLCLGTAFALLALAQVSTGMLSALMSPDAGMKGGALAYAVNGLATAAIFTVGAFFERLEVERGNRLRVLLAGVAIACVVALGSPAATALGGGGARQPGTTSVELAATVLFLIAGARLWWAEQPMHHPSQRWIAIALCVAAAAHLLIAAHPHRFGVLQVSDFFRLSWLLLVLVGLALGWIRGYRRLYRQALELDAMHRIVALPAERDLASIAEHIGSTAGQILHAEARVSIPVRAEGDEAPASIPASATEEGVLLRYLGDGMGGVTLAVPVYTEGRAAGSLQVTRPPGKPFTPTEVALLQALGRQASVLLERALLRDDVAASAIREERSRLAREIHDGLAQHLAFLKMRVAWLRRRADMPEHEQLREVEQVLETALTEARQAISALRAEPGGPSVSEAVTSYAREFGQISGLSIQVQDTGVFPEIGAQARTELLRIVQEALHNVRKHAYARNVTVELAREDGGAVVAVRDDGTGFASENGREGHFGLEIMRERAESVGGSLEVTSRAGAGTQVRVWVPALPAEEPARQRPATSGFLR